MLRVVLGGLSLALTAALARQARPSTIEVDLFRLVNDLPHAAGPALLAVMQLGTLAAVPLAALLALLARRARLAADLAVAGGAAWLGAKAVKQVVDRGRPDVLLHHVVVRSSEVGLGFPSGHATIAAALATAAGPYLPRPVRRASWAAVWLVAVGRMYAGAHLPLDVVGGVALGWVVGAAVHLALGVPAGAPRLRTVVEGLRAVDVEVTALEPVGLDARASTPFLVRGTAGQELFVKVIGRQQRDADVLFRAWRYLRLRTVEDEVPFATPKQSVEHEAYLLLLAAHVGARIPAVVAAAPAPGGSALLAQQRIPGRSLDRLDPDGVTDELLAAVWTQVERLRQGHIAHRDLRLANILVDPDHLPWLLDFGAAEAAASPRSLALDLAELLASLAWLVGPKRAVRSAAGVLGPEVVGTAVPLLQPLALSAATRRNLRARPGLLDQLRRQTAAAAGIQAPQLEPLARIRLSTILALLAAGFAVHLLLPQVGELRQTLNTLRTARSGWLAAAAAAAAASYPAAAVSLLGAVGPQLALLRTTTVQVASSFANRVTPASIGSLGVNVRYLQRSGVEPPAAVAAVAVNTLAGTLVHIGGLLAVLALLRQHSLGQLRAPQGWPLLIAALAALIGVGLVLWLPLGRRRILWPVLRAARQLGAVLRRPGKAARLLGGSAGVTCSNVVCLWASLAAFGAHPQAVRLAAVYLGGTAVAAASPTPGHLGAVEAALVAGLIAVGVPAAPAIAGVLAFRLLSFWLPTLPGWLAFHTLHRRGAI